MCGIINIRVYKYAHEGRSHELLCGCSGVIHMYSVMLLVVHIIPMLKHFKISRKYSSLFLDLNVYFDQIFVWEINSVYSNILTFNITVGEKNMEETLNKCLKF